MGKPAVYSTPSTGLPAQPGNQRDIERYKKIHKQAPSPPRKKSK
jgi:hypothetical protein